MTHNFPKRHFAPKVNQAYLLLTVHVSGITPRGFIGHRKNSEKLSLTKIDTKTENIHLPILVQGLITKNKFIREIPKATHDYYFLA